MMRVFKEGLLSHLAIACATALLGAGAALPAHAQLAGRVLSPQTGAPDTTDNAQPQSPQSAVLSGVGFDQKLNSQIPLDLPFRDEHGQTVQLRQYFGKRPVVMMLIFYNCTMLCTEVMNGTVRSLRNVGLEPGKQFDIVTVSINPRETPDLAAAKKKTYLADLGDPRAAAGWHFLVGDQTSIKPLADAVGFHYTFDKESQQFAHPNGIMVLTPAGRVARYYYGIDYPSRDLRFGLIEAAKNRIGSPVDQVLLLCYHYNPVSGKYSLEIMNVVRLGGLLTVALLLASIGLMMLRERRRKRAAATTAGWTPDPMLGTVGR